MVRPGSYKPSMPIDVVTHHFNWELKLWAHAGHSVDTRRTHDGHNDGHTMDTVKTRQFAHGQDLIDGVVVLRIAPLEPEELRVGQGAGAEGDSNRVEENDDSNHLEADHAAWRRVGDPVVLDGRHPAATL